MALTVQPVTNRSVRTDAAPNQYQDSSGATPEAFGASEGRALQGVGQSMQQASSMLSDVAERQKHEDSTRTVLGAKVELDDAERKFKYAEGGEFTKQGVDAIGGTKRTDEFYRGLSEKLLAPITDPKTRLVTEKMIAAQRNSSMDSVAAREAENRIKANTEVLKTAVQSAMQTAQDSATDDKVAEVQMNLALGAVRANPMGQPPEVIASLEASVRSELQTQRIARVAVQDVNQAAAMYERLKPQISGADHVKIEKTLEPLRMRQRAQGYVGEVVGQPGPGVRAIASAAGPFGSGAFGVGGASAGAAGGDTAGILPVSLARGIRAQESRGNPNAESPVGAAGPMQVMPGTAREISAQLGDGLIKPGATDADVKKLMKDPVVGQQYGEVYMQKMLQKYDGDIPTALVAYNAGPGRADQWLKTRKGPNDYSGLPAETQNYVPETMARIAKEARGDAGVVNQEPSIHSKVYAGREFPAPGKKMTAENWSLKFYKPEDMLAPTEGGKHVDARAAVMADTLGQRFFEMTGVRVGINDTGPSNGSTAGRRRGTSDPADNPHVGNSRHLHGDAFDFQIQKLTPDQKRQFLTVAREVGFSGVGFYEGKSGHLHLDAGKARSWGGLPSWAGKAMGTPTLGTSDMAVAGSLNLGSGSLPVPASMRAAAGGAQTGPARTGSSGVGGTAPGFTVPALSPTVIAPQAATGISPVAAAAGFGGGAPTGGLVPPTASSTLRPDMDFDPAGLRTQLEARIADEPPQVQSQARAGLERVIRVKETEKRGAMRQLQTAAIQHIQGGGNIDDMPASVHQALMEANPAFLDKAASMAERIERRGDKSDEGVYYKLGRMSDEDFQKVDLIEYLPQLSKSDAQKLMDRQRSERDKSDAGGGDARGVRTSLQYATAALKAIGLGDDSDAKQIARAEPFWRQMEQAAENHFKETKKRWTPLQAQEEAKRLTTPVGTSGGVLGVGASTQYLFEQGTASENAARKQVNQPIPGIDGPLRPAAALDQIPTPALQILATNYRAMNGVEIDKVAAPKLYNDFVTVQSGRSPEPDEAERVKIIGSLRKQFGPGIQTDASRRDELERKIGLSYTGMLKRMFTPRSATPPGP